MSNKLNHNSWGPSKGPPFPNVIVGLEATHKHGGLQLGVVRDEEDNVLAESVLLTCDDGRHWWFCIAKEDYDMLLARSRATKEDWDTARLKASHACEIGIKPEDTTLTFSFGHNRYFGQTRIEVPYLWYQETEDDMAN